MSADLGYFGDGSFEKPKIMFYFTNPCPKLNIETAATLPDFGSRPAFQFDEGNFECDLCEKTFISGIDMVKHWQEEMRAKTATFSSVDIPSIELKPGGVSRVIEDDEKEPFNEKVGSDNLQESINNDDQEVNQKAEGAEICIENIIEQENSDREIMNPQDNEDKEPFNEKVESENLQESINNCDQEVNRKAEGAEIDIEKIIEEENADEEVNYPQDLVIKSECEDDDFENCEFEEIGNLKMENINIKVEDTETNITPEKKFSNVEKKKILKCKYDNCDYDAGHRSLMSRHIKHTHELIRYDCTFCNDVKTIGRDGLRKHFYRNHKELSFVLSEHPSYQISEEDLAKKPSFKCEICAFNARSSWHVRKHMSSEHPDSPNTISSLMVEPRAKGYIKDGEYYVCKSCDHRTQRLDSLRMHIKRKHTLKDKNTKTEFEDGENLEHHGSEGIKNHEIENTTMKTEESEFEEKVRNIEEKRTFKCEIENCDFSTGHSSALRRHIKHTHELIRYDCSICSDVKTIGRDGLRKHFYRNHKELSFVLREHPSYQISEEDLTKRPSFKCEICAFDARSAWRVRNHMNSEHPNSQETISTLRVEAKAKEYFKEGDYYVCKSCDHRTQILDSLRMHIKRKHTEKSCSFCDFKAKDYLSLKEHAVTQHEGIISQCKHCGKNILSTEGLRRHMLHYHTEKCDTNISLSFCDQCEFNTYGKFKLKRHIQALHTKEGDYEQCPQCEYVGKSSERVKLHVQSVHEGKKVKRSASSSCEICAYTCSGKSKLALHMSAKHGVDSQIFYCDQCEFKSKYITSVNNHKKFKHDGEGYTCSYCEFNTTIKQVLSDHIDDKHLGIKKYCDECEYAAASTMCLTLHKNAKHRGIKYPCDQCEYKATQRGTLALHKKAKHQNIRYDCTQCEFTASFKGNLRAHMKTKHDSIIRPEDGLDYATANSY